MDKLESPYVPAPVTFPFVSEGWYTTAAVELTVPVSAKTGAVDVVTRLNGTPVETIPDVMTTSAATFTTGLGTSNYLVAGTATTGTGAPPAPTATAPVAVDITSGSATIGTTLPVTAAEEPPADIGGAALEVVPSKWYSETTVNLTAAASGDSNAVDIVITENVSAPYVPAVLEHLYDVRIDSPAHFKADIAALSAYLKNPADIAGKTWAPPTPPQTLSWSGTPVTATIGTSVSVSPATVPPFANGLTVQVSLEESDNTLSLAFLYDTPGGQRRLKAVGGLPGPTAGAGGVGAQLQAEPAEEPEAEDDESDEGDGEKPAKKKKAVAAPLVQTTPAMAAFVAAFNAASKLFTAATSSTPPYALPPTTHAGGGVDGGWTPSDLKEALLTQFSVDAPLPPAPVPALDQITPLLFNLMCIPDVAYLSAVDQIEVIEAARSYCQAHQAFLVVDTPAPSVGAPPSGAMTDPATTKAALPSVTVPQLGGDVQRQAFLASPFASVLFNAQAFAGRCTTPGCRSPTR